MDWIQKHAYSWSSLRAIGASKAAKSSVVWFFLIPLLVRVGGSLPDSVHIPFVDQNVELVLDVPFSWIALFFAATFFTVGNVIYALFCPTIIKSYRDYSGFVEKTGGSDYEIKAAFSHVMQKRESQPIGELASAEAMTELFGLAVCETDASEAPLGDHQMLFIMKVSLRNSPMHSA
jgi:hypothetical protein